MYFADWMDRKLEKDTSWVPDWFQLGVDFDSLGVRLWRLAECA
jgi:hypothetical protein